MRPLPILLLISLLGTFPIFAQTVAITGSVKDGQNERIPYASVFLLQIADSTMVKGVSADEYGNFTFPEVTADIYFIRASYIGKTSDLRAVVVSKDLRIGSLIIDQHVEALDEVVVNARQPLVERKTDRLIFNVENTIVSQGNSWDMLRRTPGVIATNSVLQVRNQPATVYINDRKTHLSSEEVRDLLENYPAEHVKLIEVINNPPAKYDAEGGPVLNIVTSRNISLGYKGSLAGGYTQAVFPKYTLGSSHFYKTKNLNVFASYNLGSRKDFRNVDSETNFRDATGIFSRWDTDFDKTTRAKSHAGQLNLDYTFDERNSLALTTKLLVSPDRSFDNLQLTSIRNAQYMLDSTFVTQSDLLEDKQNGAADLTYKHNFKSEGSLTVNGHYTRFNYDLTQDARSDYFDPDGAFIRRFGFFTDAKQDVDIYTAQLDVASTIDSLNITTGLKGSFIDSNSGIGFYNVTDAGQVFNLALSDDYRYKETVFAAYLSLAKDWKKISLKTGLRAEFTESSGTSVSLSKINALSYFELFPTLYVLFAPNKQNSFTFDYSRRVTRPRYEDLNPFRYYINENNFTEGNPNLVPNFSHNFNLNYTLKGKYFFDFYYRDNGNYISTLAFQDNLNLTLRDITQNVLESTSYGFDFNYGKSALSWWYFNTYISIFHEDETFTALESNNVAVTNAVDGIYIDLTNYVTLSKDGTFKGELGINYLSGFLEGSYRYAESNNVTLGLSKSFWRKSTILSLQASDLLNKANSRVTSRYLNQDNSYLSNSETQYVRFGLTINFGNFRLDDNKRNIETIESGRLKVD